MFRFNVYTSYLANLKNIDTKKIIPIAICGSRPATYSGLFYRSLMPKKTFFKEYKDGIIDEQGYIKAYFEKVLSLITPKKVMIDLEFLGCGKDVVLWCYEKPGDFCHRHIVKEWLSQYGCEEYENKRKNVVSSGLF